MQEFANRVAVITGAAHGIGYGLAERAAQEGMRVVMADIDAEALHAGAEALRAAGADVRAVVTDVSQFDQVEALAEAALDAFGAIHLVFSNAGISSLDDLHKPVWDVRASEWKNVIAVNIGGVANSIRVFVPRLVAQPDESHLVFTASETGLDTAPGMGLYRATKHAAVSLCEGLYQDLQQHGLGDKIGVSLLCPGPVDTHITQGALARFAAESGGAAPDAPVAKAAAHVIEVLRQGMTPAEVAARTFDAIRARQFYIITHPEVKERARQRVDNIIREQPPANPWA